MVSEVDMEPVGIRSLETSDYYNSLRTVVLRSGITARVIARQLAKIAGDSLNDTPEEAYYTTGPWQHVRGVPVCPVRDDPPEYSDGSGYGG
jgi:hypothetical protein